MKFKSLVTGATGFLGKALKKLNKEGHKVFDSSTSIANLYDIKNLLIYKKVNFDFIFHTAAVTYPGKKINDLNIKQWVNNQLINTNIINFWYRYQPNAKFITFGTSAMYSQKKEMIEKNCLLDKPEKQYYIYGITKRMLLEGLIATSDLKNMKYIFYIPTIIYGPNFKLDDGHFIYDLIRKIYAGKKFGKDVILWGDGNQERDLIYIDDAVNSIYSNLNLNNEIINLGRNHSSKIVEYAKIISDYLNYDYNLIKFDKDRDIGVKKEI